MKRIAWLGGLALAGLLPAVAQAATGVVTEATLLTAGPGGYPTVASVPAGAKVDVLGCTSSYTWCDVAYGPDRGWVAGTRIALPIDGRDVVVVQSGPRVSVPIIAFEFGPYWQTHYTTRSFYSERERWAALRAEQNLREEAAALR